MSKREKRLNTIRDVVQATKLSSQSQISAALAKKNLTVNQSTLSRDLTELGVQKVKGVYQIKSGRQSDIYQEQLAFGVLGWKACGPHLIVMHTRIGQAQAIGVAIDRKQETAIEGTIAGDDTLLLVSTSKSKQSAVLRKLAQWFGDKNG